MSDTNELVIDQIELQAAQYIPNHDGHCVFVHGHTYVINNLHIGVKRNAFLDFGKIKKMFSDHLDHVMFVPHRFYNDWMALRPLLKPMGADLKLVGVPGDNTVEEQSWLIVRMLRELDTENIVMISFCITEGLHQGIQIRWKK